MPSHSETRILPYTPAQLFDLVMDVEKYPEFLPWCLSAKIIEKQKKTLTADMTIGYKALRETYRSHVTFVRPEKIDVRYGGGPLSHLSNAWVFHAVGSGACELTFDVDVDFQSKILSSIMNMFFDRAFIRMVSAFEQRAAAIYA
ncbi:MAG: type II toxin-antitoxin system RatA family toxin [Alphaproteobacteria bacterium]|nr:type II toxin-antitoxin system RatA family toxin [Alphaproteobacteria bacterium]NDC55656.1 type II toxin-antitoxin system RatA family toxin [Alphaproteobacteria bacterium]NDG05113.1 type II toxin-antitoxin system RatA family toxin [Alphaproteobacteria bacterium]